MGRLSIRCVQFQKRSPADGILLPLSKGRDFGTSHWQLWRQLKKYAGHPLMASMTTMALATGNELLLKRARAAANKAGQLAAAAPPDHARVGSVA